MNYRLLDAMIDLLHYTKSDEFDLKTFGVKCKNFTDLYKRCSQEIQGSYHELWADYLKKGS